MKSYIISFCIASTMPATAQQTVKFAMDNDEGYHGVKTAELVQGAVGKALRFDGYSTYIKTNADFSGIDNRLASFSLWCAAETYPMVHADEAVNEWTAIAGNMDETARTGFAFTLSSQGDYAFECYAAGWRVACKAASKLPKYSWNYLVATVDVDAKTLKLYNNGTLVGTARCPYALSVGTADCYIGKSAREIKLGPFHLDTFNGLIDDFTVSSGIMTESQIKALPEQSADLSVPTSRFAGDMLRPRMHGMPAAAWTNETHGLTWYEGKYHLFFQKNANGPYMSRLHWGHLTSENLYDWTEEHIALSPAETYDIKGCWSGCLMPVNGEPTIIYTAVDNAKASIAQAMPVDKGLVEWEKSALNPIINGRPAGLSDDFRDPYFFECNGQKYLVVGTSKNGIGAATLHRYDGNTWSNDGKIFFAGKSQAQDGTFWEMPTVTQIGQKWLFTVTPLNTSQGVETLYWTGNITADGTFEPDYSTPKKLELEGMGKQGYGLLSPSIMQKDGKTILLGIVPDKLTSEENYKLGWAHTYSLPREITIAPDGSLLQKPFEGLKGMRQPDGYEKNEFMLSSEEELSGLKGRCFEIDGTFIVGSGAFGFELLNGATISYNPATNRLSADFSSIERIVNDKGLFDGVYQSELPQALRAGEECRIHLFFDHSIIDVFINECLAFSVRVFPTAQLADVPVKAFANGLTEVKVLRGWLLGTGNGTNNITSIHTLQRNGMEIYNLNGQPRSTTNWKGVHIVRENGKVRKII